ncbi:MAG: outer membrane homotrimeric porin, partial [Desulfovibrio sp.]|nr:outer membrane homotrimeric porin [Desulfovibrio sp.]
FTTGSNVFNDDVAGVTLSYQFTENVGATFFWARPWNDNFAGYEDRNGNQTDRRQNYVDNVDAFGLLVPFTFDGVKVTPWVMYSMIGPNAWRDHSYGGNNRQYYANVTGVSRNWAGAGMLPVGGAIHKDGTPSTKTLKHYGSAIWAGLTGELTMFDPLRIAWDFNYGSVQYSESRMNRAGWLASLLVEYKLDWGIPGIYGWYASGDDGNPANGSERMPSLSVNNNNNGFSNFAYNGNPYIAREAILGYDMSGTWGIGARLKDMSFLEDLKHTFRVNLIGGTNSTTMTRYLGRNDDFQDYRNGANAGPAVGMQPLYMTTNDYAMEIGLTNTYKMYENFTVMLDMAYLATWMDHSRKVWGNTRFNGDDDTVKDPWNINLSFVYSF